MRRNQKNGAYYKELLKSPTHARHKLQSLNSDNSLPELRSSKSASKKLSNSSNAINMIRLGSPSETLIHLPKHLSILKKSAIYSLNTPRESLESVIAKVKKVDMKDVKINPEIIDKLNSLQINITSFDEFLKYRPSHVMNEYEMMKNREYMADFTNRIKEGVYNCQPELLKHHTDCIDAHSSKLLLGISIPDNNQSF